MLAQIRQKRWQLLGGGGGGEFKEGEGRRVRSSCVCMRVCACGGEEKASFDVILDDL